MEVVRVENETARGPWIAVAAVLLIAALAAGTGAIHARLYGHDIFFLLDNGWRALHGQRVHLDYSSGWGPLTFLLIAAGLAVSGGSVAAVSYANAMAASALGLYAAWLTAGRERTVISIALPCFVALLVAAPFALGEAPIWTSHGMVYNRYGFAILTLILLESIRPPDQSIDGSRGRLEPFLTGCCAGLLLFLKITYFLVALPILVAACAFRKSRGERLFWNATGFVAVSFLFLIYLRFDAGAMIRDLAAVGAARSGSLGVRRQFQGLLVGGLLRVAAMVPMLARRYRREWKYPLTAVLVVVADGLLQITNAQVDTYPFTAAFAMVLLVSATFTKRDQPLWVIAAVFAMPMFLMQCAGLGYAFGESMMNPNPAGAARFDSARLRPLVLYDAAADSVDKYSNGREYVSSVNDGIRLLSAHTRPDEKIATLDMFNPFAYALGREPIRGGIAAAAYRYTLDDRHHPSPARFFGDAAVVMVPKQPASPPIFWDGYSRIYEPALEASFRLEAESPAWRLYRRTAHPLDQ
jgi:hypothetical protein